ncbi:MAG: glycosyltransferase family 4 protein [Acidimicrobiales bacterium]|nr:glycosyltransferase family 4 protein [Acidimicrobiales bacterium]
MTALPTIVVVSPIEPSSTGNGLAMRVETMVAAAAQDHLVELIVVPVAGRPPVVRTDVVVANRHDVSLPSPRQPSTLVGWLGSQRWRDRLSAAAPLPDPVARTPLADADALATHLAALAPVAVLACRLTTAMFALRIAEALDLPLLIDLDDDDEDLARSLEDEESADGWHRLAALILASAATSFAASDRVARAITARHDLDQPVVVVANPAPVPSRPIAPPPGDRRLLMMANFGYEPNAEGARWFVDEVMAGLDGRWTCDLVGAGSSEVSGIDVAGVRSWGHVDDVSVHYEACDVVVVPILHGSGTRIKVLEAFAHHRPVVATTVAVDGLALIEDVHAMLADDAASFAAAIQRCEDPEHTAPLVAAAALLTSRAYDRGVITREAARHVRQAGAGSPTTGPREERS